MGDIVSSPTYFGPTDAPLFGVMSYPADRRARSAILLCTSIGKEQAETTRGLKLFAERLAARGFAVLRFDYRCTGESSGEQYQPDAVQHWIVSVGHAAEYLRSVGAPSMVTIGHRVGALLLAHSSIIDAVDATVWWDPVSKGRQYIRAKRVLYNIVSETSGQRDPDPTDVRGPDDSIFGSFDPAVDYVHTAGQSLHPDAAAQFAHLTLPDEAGASIPADRVLVVTRSTDRGAKFVKGQFNRGVTVFEVDDQEPFLEPNHPALLSFPVEEFDRIIGWIDEVMPAGSRAINPLTRDTAVVAHTADGRPIVTRLSTIGKASVWDTAIAGCHDTATAVFIGHSLGQYVRTGPSRLWGEVARSVATRGGRAIGYDRPTVGESGHAAVSDSYLPLYTRDYVAVGTAIIEGLEIPAGATVAHSGICVGSWMAAHGALNTARRQVKSVAVLVNPLMWRLPPQREYHPDILGAADEIIGIPATAPTSAFVARIRRALWWRIGHCAPTIRRVLPRALWRSAARLPMVQLPDAVFETFAVAGVVPHLVFAPTDFRFFEQAVGGSEAIRQARIPVGLHVAHEGDHTSYNAEIRREIARVCLSALGL